MNFYVIDWRARSFRVFSTWDDVQLFFTLGEVSALDRETKYMVIRGRDMDPAC